MADDPIQIEQPVASVRGQHKVGDEVSMYGTPMRVASLRGDGSPVLEQTGPQQKTETPSGGKVKPWWEIAQHFDPMMDQGTYDQLRRHYFDKFVKPQVPKDFSAEATWKEFEKATQRDSMLNATQRSPLMSLENSIGRGFAEEVIRPLKGVPGLEGVYDTLQGTFEHADTLAKREGVDHPAGRFGGEAAGIMATFMATEGAVKGMEILPLAEDFSLTGSAAKLLDRTMRGGVTFAAYEAAVAGNEDRGVAALKGFAVGATFEGGMSLAGKLLRHGVEAKNVAKIVQDALTPGKQIDPEIDALIADHVQQDVKVAKQEGRASFLNEQPGVKNPEVRLKKSTGEEVVEQLLPGKEQEALNRIQFYTQQGGEVIGINFASEHEGLVNSFLRLQEKSAEAKYATRTVKVPEGTSKSVAADMQLEGHAAEPIGDDTVQVATPRQVPTRDQVKEYLAQKNIHEPELTNRTAQVMQLWNPKLPPKSAQLMLDSLKGALGVEKINGLLPDHLKLPEQSIHYHGTAGENLQSIKAKGLIPGKSGRVYLATNEAETIGYGDSVVKVDTSGLKLIDDPEFNMHLEDDPETIAEGYRWKYVEGGIPAGRVHVEDAIRELGGDSEQTFETRDGKVSRLFSMLELPTTNKYIQMQMEDILSELGHEPEMVDDILSGQFKDAKELGDFLKNEEIGKSLEDEIAQKGKDITAPGAMEEAVRKGEFVPAGRSIRVPASESLLTTERAISQTPSRIAIKVTPGEMESLHPGSYALTAMPGKSFYEEIFDKLGIKSLDPADPRPLHLYSSVDGRADIWHEGTHVGIIHASNGEKATGIWRAWQEGAYGEGAHQAAQVNFNTARQIAQALKTYPAYAKMSYMPMIEEAFVHASTAVRMGDVTELGKMAALDTSVRHVLDMVEDFAVKAVDESRAQPDSYPQRVFQRSMNNVIRKSSYEQMWELRNAEEMVDAYTHYDPLKKAWVFLRADGSKNYSTIAGLIDDLDNVSGSAFAPSSSLPLELRGVRGPFMPRGGGPTKDLPLPEAGLPEGQRGMGWKAISGAFRPMLPWVADVDTFMNETFSTRGQRYPIYDKVKAVDEAMQAGDQWLIDKKEQAAEFLKGNPKKLYEYMDVLTAEQKYWPDMQTKLKLTDEDMGNLSRAESWLKNLQAETHIPAFNYLREQLPMLRSFNFDTERVYGGRAKDSSDMSFFHGAIKDGSLNPKDAHLGRFINFLTREGFEKKFTNQPIQELKKLVDFKGKDGGYLLGAMRWPLENYVNYVKGIPDVTQRVITKAAGDFQSLLGAQFKRLNKYLPDGAKLPEEFNYPGNFINRLMTLSYVGSLGARPAIALRDAMQVLTTSLPVLQGRVLRGGGLTRAGIDRATEAGALLTKTNVGELYGDIFNEMPAGGNMLDKASKLANKLLAPSRWGHNIARSLAYNAEYESTLDAVGKFRSGQIDAHTLMTDTSIWFHDRPAINQILKMAADGAVPAEEVAKRSGLELVDNTLWPYRRGAQPALLRTGLGRIFGQYGMWPLNYMDFLKRMVSKYHEFPAQSLKASATWVGSNYAAVAAMNAGGADVGKWFFVSPSGYGGSPHLELVEALAKSPENTDEGRASRKKVLEYPLNFIPTMNEMKSVMRALDEGGPAFNDNGMPNPNLLRVLGFRPLDEAHEQRMQDLSIGDDIDYQLGLKRVK